MSTWHRIDSHGIHVTFSATPDERGNVTLTREEFEGLMRTGRWSTEPPSFADQLGAMSIAASVQKHGEPPSPRLSLEERAQRLAALASVGMVSASDIRAPKWEADPALTEQVCAADAAVRWMVRAKEAEARAEKAERERDNLRAAQPATITQDAISADAYERGVPALRDACPGGFKLSIPAHEAVRAIVAAVLTATPPRLEGAEEIEEEVMTAAREAGVHLDAETAGKFADSLASQGVRVGGAS